MEEEEEAIGFLDKVSEDEDVFLSEECESGTPTSPGSGSPFLVAVKVEAGKGSEMRKLVLSGFSASEEIYINQSEASLSPGIWRTESATVASPGPSCDRRGKDTPVWEDKHSYPLICRDDCGIGS